MKAVRQLAILTLICLFYGEHGLAQEVVAEREDVTNTPAAKVYTEEEKTWEFSVGALFYIVPDSREYVQPTVTADRNWLHLEARYNYEARETGSAWIGYNFSIGEKVQLDFTPMIGGFFGNSNGVAPGYKGALSWSKIKLSTEGEYAISTADSSEHFFYTWTELSLVPVEWFRVGLVIQRTKLFQTEFDIQRGVLVGLSYKKLDFTTYLFNPDGSEPTVVLGVGVSF